MLLFLQDSNFWAEGFSSLLCRGSLGFSVKGGGGGGAAGEQARAINILED